jgi:preprotein translocase subunit SecB
MSDPDQKNSVPQSVAALSKMPVVAVRLQSSSSQIHQEAFAASSEMSTDQLGIDITTGGGRSSEPQTLLVSNIAVTVRMIRKDKQTIATLQGTWQVAFQADSEEALHAIDDDLAVAFNTFVAPRMAWPFAREFFVNLCWRMQMPPAMLPPYRPELFPDFFRAGAEAAARHDARIRQKS